MKTLIEIQNEVVRERGFSSFTAFARHPDIAELQHRISIIDEIAKRYATECIKAGWNLSREKMPDFDGSYYVYGFMHNTCGTITPFHKIVECKLNQWVKSDVGEQMTYWRNLLPNPEQVEAIKANGLKIVNIDSHVAVWTEGEKILWALAGNVTELKPGDSLSLPSGFEFKEEERFICTGVGDPLEAKFCHTKLAGECSCEKVIFIRIVKTEVKEYTNPDESLEERRLGQLIAKHIMGWTLNPENIEAVKKVAIEFSKPEPEESQTELWKEFWGIMYKSSKNPREHFTISRKSPK